MDGAKRKYLTLSQAADLCPGRKPCSKTLERWVKKGVSGVRLRAVYTHRWYTTERWLDEFLRERTEARMHGSMKGPGSVSGGTREHPGVIEEAAEAAAARIAERWDIDV